MAPVFSQRWHLYLFTAFMSLLMLLPLVSKPDIMDRRVLYRSFELHPYIYYSIPDEVLTAKHINILFVGSSLTGRSNDPYFIKSEFSKRFGFDPTVFLLYHSNSGWEMDYTLIKDTLEHTKVDLIVLETSPRMLHNSTYKDFMPFLWDYAYHFDMLGTSWVHLKDVYLYSLLNNFKLLGSMFMHLTPQDQLTHPDCNQRLVFGCQDRYSIYRYMNEDARKPNIPASHVMHWLRKANSPYYHLKQGYSEESLWILSNIISLAKEHGTAMMFINYPTLRYPNYNILLDIPGYVGAQGIPTLSLNVTELARKVSISHFYEDSDHLNPKGTFIHTRNIIPSLLNHYERVTKRKAKIKDAEK